LYDVRSVQPLSIRTRVVRSVYQQLIGPRGGIEETLKNPDFEYVAGVLEPKDYEIELIEESPEQQFSSVQQSSEVDQTSVKEVDDLEQQDDLGSPSILPEGGLDPRSRPKSLGVSFCIAGKNPKIDLCITYARYFKAEGGSWKRKPQYILQRGIEAITNWDNAKSASKKEGLGVYLTSIPLSGDIWKVSVYAVNETTLEDKNHYSTGDLIFQPQIRILCSRDASLVAMPDVEIEDNEERMLNSMYMNRKTFARGHMVSAIWEMVDPDRDGGKWRPENQLFEWQDAKILPKDVASTFLHSHVRTEYLPSYSVQQPRAEIGPAAEDLTEMYDPAILTKSLSSVIHGYSEWIDGLAKMCSKDPSYKDAKSNLDLCTESLRRMEDGIHILADNDDARLAFCFMNKAMDLQFRWEAKRLGNPKRLEWYRFQLAFILQCIRGIVNPLHEDRNKCDLLWYPTGGGKTEAYLALMVFALAYRRVTKPAEGFINDGGITTISRYTLRLLTIQQFRRSLRIIMACEYLRVGNWTPKGRSGRADVWGRTKFSIGLWVGNDLTPNRMEVSRSIDEIFLGAIGSLLGKESFRSEDRDVRDDASEPAQVLGCPCCDTILSIPTSNTGESIGLDGSRHTLRLIIRADSLKNEYAIMNSMGFTVDAAKVVVEPLPAGRFYAISIPFTYTGSIVSANKIDAWWRNHISKALGVHEKDDLCSARASRPGYFLKFRGTSPYDFEIRCPNFGCELNKIEWREEIPSAVGSTSYSEIPGAFKIPQKKGYSWGMPIHAFTTDAQVYRHCPSFLISTVDKFARLPFEPHTASLFGNIDCFDSILGYFRKSVGPNGDRKHMGSTVDVQPFSPPMLIIQDELHLIDGPLGSMVGLYEAAVDELATLPGGIRPKYLASTATIREAENQVKALFDRKLAVFPPPGVLAEDRYFTSFHESDVTDSIPPGRLYVGVCTPGKILITIVRMWSVLLKEMQIIKNEGVADQSEIDAFWTLAGYFNSLRELAIALSIYNGTEIRGRIGNDVSGKPIRELSDESYFELSGQSSSANLPNILRKLERSGSFDVDALFTTSMFGTGIDISRLSLMIVHGQPKNTSSYVQATGRVGRAKGGLVITFLRSTRPRDLNHYEFFIGYHRAIQRFVEPVSVYPFSPKGLSRAMGPIAVALLRNARSLRKVRINDEWAPEQVRRKKVPGERVTSGSQRMALARNTPDVNILVDIIEDRSQAQPGERKPADGATGQQLSDGLDLWENFAIENRGDLLYWEQTLSDVPVHHAVLGSPQYTEDRAVFKNAPQSVREVESTCGFGDDVW
jgi:hypothetical protein